MNDLVTVVIPTYKRADSICRAIDSVLQQSYKNVEIIVVDDNNPNTLSRLETEKAMSRYEQNDKVRYIKHEKNKNGSAARNTGWKNSNGKYIAFLDDDDYVHPTRIEKMVARLESLDESWGACYTGYLVKKENGRTQISSENREGDCYIDALMRTFYIYSGSNVLLRRSVLDEIGGFDESFRRSQDLEFIVRVLEKNKITYIDEVLLTICLDGSRGNGLFLNTEEGAKYYLNRFKSRIDQLNKDDRERVISVISLDRCRMAIQNKHLLYGIRILQENNVSALYICRYIKYIINRLITKKSYGFNGK